MAANTIQIKFRKDAPTHSISITADLDELISTTKERVAEELAELDPAAKLKPNQSLKFMAFGRILEDDKKWRYYQKGVLDLLKVTNSSVILSVQTNIKEETKKYASEAANKISASSATLSSSNANPSDLVDQTKDPLGVQLPSQGENLHSFHRRIIEGKQSPPSNKSGKKEDSSIVRDPTEPPPERKRSCNIM